MISKTRLKKIRKIMLPIDGSATSMKAARIGISLAKKFRSDLIGLTVIDLMSLPYGYFLTQPGTRSHDNILEEKRTEAKKWLDKIERSMLEGRWVNRKLVRQNLDQKSSKIHSPG